jgi:thioredoxin 2
VTIQMALITCPNCGKRNRVASSGDGVPRCGHCHEPLPWTVDATAESFEAELSASVPALVDFWAPWCGPCKFVAPVVEELGRRHIGRLKVVRLDIDQAPDLAARHQVRGIPTLALFRDGREIDRISGAPSRPQLEEWVERHLGASAAT